MAYTAPPLPAETLQHIAQYFSSSNEMHVYVTALPQAWLTPPMAALHELYACVRDGRLADTSAKQPKMVQLWPEVQLPTSFTDAPLPRSEADAQLVVLLRTYLLMLPRITTHVGRSISDFVPPGTNLCIDPANFVDELERAADLGNVEELRVLIRDCCDGSWPPHAFDCIRRMSRLRELRADWLPLRGTELQTNFVKMLACSSITRLAVHYHDSAITWSEATGKAFVRWIRSAPITSLELGHLPLCKLDAARLSVAILQLRTLKVLKVEGTLARMLFAIIVHQPFLLKVGRLALPPQLETLEAVVEHERDVVSVLRVIRGTNLRHVSLFWDEPLDDPTALALRSVLASLQNLRQLELGGVNMPPIDLAPMQRLEQLELHRSTLGDPGVIPTVWALPQCRWLRHLSLVDQGCTYLTAEALAAVVPHCPSLKTLQLSYNNLGTEGFIALLPIVGSLDALLLRANGIDVDGALMLAHHIDATAHLTDLELSGNPIAKYGIISIIDSMITSSIDRRGTVGLCNTVDEAGDIERCMEWAAALPNRAWVKLDVHSF
ncbi:hypothetical protein SPRG_15116 [Saprolegnia parasitica CBS 223.65]|uniref:RNI-like protein n=1 Tax=Saprolegnia parasitica (strain CBS 223.65) TaxID=695850 RepID=A0A067BXG5_SAPPC|nr:hypothetical protein SPRG_15116 [Saprolegnia parasitica CBS 223.65]KDO19242.1 hypothetical protein SPRG_15116 [Saprolegnia parasitica CBS 223.65]|eukprot:XP_012210047.1 hypothetical protein SPRG_15116 [Saprolegnia parasitica CBS 223.65]